MTRATIMSSDLIRLSIRARGKGKSGIQVEQRRDGFFYVSALPDGCKGLTVGDRIIEINGVKFDAIRNEEQAKNLIDTFQVEIIPVNNWDDEASTDDDNLFDFDDEDKDDRNDSSVDATSETSPMTDNVEQRVPGGAAENRSPKKGPGRREYVEYLDESDSESDPGGHDRDSDSENTNREILKSQSSTQRSGEARETRIRRRNGGRRREIVEYLDDDTTDEELVLGEEDDTNDDFVNRQRTVELSISGRNVNRAKSSSEGADRQNQDEDGHTALNYNAGNLSEWSSSDESAGYGSAGGDIDIDESDDDDYIGLSNKYSPFMGDEKQAQELSLHSNLINEEQYNVSNHDQSEGQSSDTSDHTASRDLHLQVGPSCIPGDEKDHEGDSVSESSLPLSPGAIRHAVAKSRDSQQARFRPRPESFLRPYVSKYSPNDKWMITVKTEAHDEIGISLVQHKQEMFVTDVEEGPFFDTALDKGDKILSINGRKIPHQLSTLTEAEDLMRGSTKLTLYVLRPDHKNDAAYRWVMDTFE